jgi:outer membrane receptor protein involved in Fe transport
MLLIAALLGMSAWAQEGEIVGVLFRADGTPVAGARVSVLSEQTVTDEGGAWRLELAPGVVAVKLEVAGLQPAEIGSVPVVEGRTTELLVTVGAGEPRVSLEVPPESAVASELPSGPPGELSGVVLDRDGGRPLGGVRLFVRGSDLEVTTDTSGRFVLQLPAGTWDISAVRAGYGTETRPVEVVAHEQRTVSLELVKAGLLLEELTVKAPRITGGTASLLDERQDSSTVSDVLGAEQMSRSGDSDAASALRRVTGLTVIGGKYVYVRGLGDRYSATLLNGSTLPSPEPERRVVPLDLFPTSLIEAVVIQKTFSPDRPAEFGGGVVEVRTRSIPQEPVLSITLSGSWIAGTTLAEAQLGDRGPTDWLGLGRAHRALPQELAKASEEQAIKAGGIFSEEGYSADELERFGELLPNRWGLAPRGLPPDFGVTMSAGGRVPVGSVELGALAGLVFSNGWNISDGYQALYSQGAEGLEQKRKTTFTETQNRVRLGGALALGLEGEGGSVQSTTLLMRNSAATALIYDADDPTGSNDTHNTRISWEEQQLLFQQLSAEARLGVLTLEGRYAGALASRHEPDRRDTTYLATEDGLVLSQRGSWSEIMYTELGDTTHDGALDATLAVGEASLKTGGRLVLRDRTSTTRRFGFQFQGSEGIDLTAPVEQVIVPDNIGAEGPDDPGYLELEENTTSSDDYSAEQQLTAGYLMGDVPWSRRITTLLGARVERSTQRVSTFELFDTHQTPVQAELTTTDVLPAATVTFGLGPAEEPQRMLVRVGYGRTLSRPEFRELSQVAFYDYRSGRLLYGNPDLERATIENLDARWEWYPRAGESLSAGVFYKYFDHPIESVIAVSAVSGSVGTFANATSARNFGAELDFRQRLDILHEALAPLSISANTSFIASRVDLSGTEGNQTSQERPLQGQSPWVVNAQLAWEDPERRRNVALLYNVFGPRIVDVGTSGIPDTYDRPVHRVDFVASQGLGPHWSVRLRGANLLDWPIQRRVGDEISEETRDGWSAGLALTWTP